MQSLRQLHWRRLRLRLRNHRNTFAREHPLFIFRAIFNYAAGMPGSPGKDNFTFYPEAHSLTGTIRKGHHYDLNLIFPTADSAAINNFCVNLEKHLSDPNRNFEIVSTGHIEERNLELLLGEAIGKLDMTSEEIALDFITPFSFPVPESQRKILPQLRWRLPVHTFVEFLKHRFNDLIPDLKHEVSGEVSGLRLLPYFWDYKTFAHSSKKEAIQKQPR